MCLRNTVVILVRKKFSQVRAKSLKRQGISFVGINIVYFQRKWIRQG